jgi:hypothetical protein
MSQTGWQNRIVGQGVKPANQFRAHPNNWRRHPDNQRNSIRGSLGSIGWIQQVIENVRTGNLIDGHARVEEALARSETEPVPFIQVDLSPEEEKLALAVLDPISAQAASDKEQFNALLQEVETDEPGLLALLEDLAKANAVESEKQAEAGDTTEQLGGLEFRIVVECADEQQQAELLERFESEGLKCKALMS